MKTLKSVVVFLMLLVAGSVMTLSAQNRTISGKVFDANEEPLIGVTVAVESATIGAVTDIDGAFTIQVPEGKVVLNVSYIGFASQQVTVAAKPVDCNRPPERRCSIAERNGCGRLR